MKWYDTICYDEHAHLSLPDNNDKIHDVNYVRNTLSCMSMSQSLDISGRLNKYHFDPVAWSLDTHPAAMALDCHRTLARDSWAGFSHKTIKQAHIDLRAPWSPWSNSETSQIPPFTPHFPHRPGPLESKSTLIWPTFGQHPIISSYHIISHPSWRCPRSGT